MEEFIDSQEPELEEELTPEQEPEQEQILQEEIPEDKRAKKGGTFKTVAIAFVCGLLAAALIVAVLFGAGVFDAKPQETTVPEESGAAPTVNYTVDQDKALSMAGQVVATSGDQKLTNGGLQIYYWMGVYDYLNSQYGYYLSMYGIDLTKPLHDVVYDQETGRTWQQEMVDFGLQNWQRYIAIYQTAKAEGFQLDQEGVDYLAQLPERITQMAEDYNYASVREMLDTQFGTGSTEEAYLTYMQVHYYASKYMDGRYDALLPTDAEIEAYFEENKETLAEQSVTKESGDVVDVRHILITPEGGTEDAEGNVTYTDAQWAAGLAEAEALLQQWKDGEATENSFAELAAEHSEDGGSSGNGGLYQSVTKDYMVEAFDAWIFDDARAAGDTDIVKTPFGYHIMYFVEKEAMWYRASENGLISQRINDAIAQMEKQYPMTVNYDQIGISHLTEVTVTTDPAE